MPWGAPLEKLRAEPAHRAGPKALDTFERMDRMYRYQRHFYDFTRKYYLLGRDQLLDQIPLRGHDTVLEVACGTGRNLRKLADRHPDVRLFGLDASEPMLAAARHTLKQPLTTGQVVLKRELAENLSHRLTFGLMEPFDVVFFSYGLSMIPTWQRAVDAALANLRPGGELLIVDFWDQQSWNRLFRAGLRGWLKLFGVEHRPALMTYLQELDARGTARLEITSISRRYAYVARLIKPVTTPERM